jgi:hypothetical protein
MRLACPILTSRLCVWQAQAKDRDGFRFNLTELGGEIGI